MFSNKWNMKKQDYGNDEEFYTPFLRARQEWDNRTGKVVKSAERFSFLAIGLMFLLFISMAMNLIQASNENEVTHIVEVDRATGEETYIGTNNTSMDDKTRNNVVNSKLEDYVGWMRNIGKDAVVISENWQKLNAHTTETLSQRINNDMRENDYVSAHFGRETIQVKVNNILKRGDDTYQIRWTEEKYSMDSKPLKPFKTYTGLFTYVWLTPEKKTLRSNPLGFFVDEFQFKEDL